MHSKIRKTIRFLHDNDGSLTMKTMRSGFWVITSSFGLNILTLVRSIVLARLLMPEVFGLMTVCLIVIRSVEVFTRTGVEAALIHRKESFDEARDTAFSIMVARGVLLFLIIFFSAPYIALFYNNEILATLIKVLGISFIFNGFDNINRIALAKELDFRRLMYLDQAVAIVNTMVVITLAFMIRSVWALIIGHLISSAVQMTMSYVLIPGKPHFRFDRKIARELYKYGKYITGLSIVLFMASELDNAVLGKIVGMSELGYYVIAFTIANLPSTQISKVASQVMFPAYSKLQADLPALRDAYLKTTKLVASLAVPASAGFIILASEIIHVIYGNKWEPATQPLQILCIFGALRSVASLNGYLLNGIGKPNIDFYLGLIRLTLIAVMIYPLTKAYHLIGASVAVTVPMALQFVLSTYAVKKFIKAEVFDVFKLLSLPLIYSLIMAVILLVLKERFLPGSVYSLIILILVGLSIYAMLSWRDLNKIWAYYKSR